MEGNSLMITSLLVDADILIYKASFVSETGIEWEPGCYNLIADMNLAKDIFHGIISDAVKKLEADKVILFISGKNNFRKAINPTYKSNRDYSFRPLLVKPMLEWIESGEHGYRVICEEGFEADDMISAHATGFDKEKYRRIIVSIDKDFGAVPLEFYHVDRRQLWKAPTFKHCENFSLVQTLSGDPTDGYYGIKGVGEASARKRLERDGWKFQTVVDFFLEKGYTKEDALVNTWMARFITRKNFKTRTLYGGYKIEEAVQMMKEYRLKNNPKLKAEFEV